MTGQGKKMDLKEQIYSVLVVSASENFNNALSALLPAFRYAPVRYVSGISAAKRILSERDFDFLILNSPLPDGPGTDLAIDFSSSSGGIALLIVRSDMLEGIRSKVTPHGVFTLSKPLSIEMFSAALDWMVSARERLRNSERKSLSFEEKMREIIHGGATTILVSHSLSQVRDMCNKILWLNKGKQIAFGEDVKGICDQYQEFLDGKRKLT